MQTRSMDFTLTAFMWEIAAAATVGVLYFPQMQTHLHIHKSINPPIHSARAGNQIPPASIWLDIAAEASVGPKPPARRDTAARWKDFLLFIKWNYALSNSKHEQLSFYKFMHDIKYVLTLWKICFLL